MTPGENAEAAQGSKVGARRKLKRKKASQQNHDCSKDEDDKESSGSQSDEISLDENEEFDVDFSFNDPCEEDFHSVSGLLKGGIWQFMELNFTELADSVVGQGNIGSIVKSNADAGVDHVTDCALLTALNLRQFANLSWPLQISKALVAKATQHADDGVAKQLEKMLDRSGESGEVGLLLAERFPNIPLALVPPLYAALQDDIEWSITTPECPEDERPYYRFARFVAVVRCFGPSGKAPASSSVETPAKRIGKKKRRLVSQNPMSGSGIDGQQVFFPLIEHEVCMRKASLSFTFPVQSTSDGKKKGPKGLQQERRAVFVLTRKALGEVVAELKADLPENE
eukprot:TRINITY_DN42965_c0_g1_i1.p1 TRINITY_DN42965_c0_g1~~TRINITY_DN42965_c0_g1_i1.p1  ORF type:complete len:340 (-),score=58.58 TRINITY_DN42965_c0_g1_i1:213-1232(-)